MEWTPLWHELGSAKDPKGFYRHSPNVISPNVNYRYRRTFGDMTGHRSKSQWSWHDPCYMCHGTHALWIIDHVMRHVMVGGHILGQLRPLSCRCMTYDLGMTHFMAWSMTNGMIHNSLWPIINDLIYDITSGLGYCHVSCRDTGNRFLPVNTGKSRQKIKNTKMFNTGFQNLESKFGKWY